jgi:peptide/nickel transport system permease protein
MVFSIFGMSLPSFVAAILIMWLFAYLLGSITGLEVTGSLYEIDEFEGKRLVLKNLILPAITLGVRPLAVFMQLTRNSMLDVLSMDYVRTATAKGLSFKTVVMKHALRNALNPVITAISGWLASLLAGAVFVEIVFGWKGLGLIMLNALNTYDLPVVMGCIILVAVIFVVINMLVDVLYGIFDPRVSIQ